MSENKYNLPRGYLSYSQVNKYLLCGQDYKSAYIDGEPFVAPFNMILGSTVHEAVAAHFEEMKAAGTCDGSHGLAVI